MIKFSNKNVQTILNDFICNFVKRGKCSERICLGEIKDLHSLSITDKSVKKVYHIQAPTQKILRFLSAAAHLRSQRESHCLENFNTERKAGFKHRGN